MTNPSDQPRQNIDDELIAMLKYLRLGRLLAQWDETLEKARKGRYSSERLLKYIVQQEYRAKRENSRLLRRQRANIPEMLEMETFPFDKQPKLDRKRVMSLYDNFDYMTKQPYVDRDRIVIMGHSGGYYTLGRIIANGDAVEVNEFRVSRGRVAIGDLEIDHYWGLAAIAYAGETGADVKLYKLRLTVNDEDAPIAAILVDPTDAGPMLVLLPKSCEYIEEQEQPPTHM
jgi:hypothetical protein